jgi:D-psicose/D-tagatose/L-ribulose 3-epimerase
MRIGTHLSLWQRDWNEDVAVHVDRAAALGADGVEISLYTLRGLDVRALRRRIEAAGLGVTCSTGLLQDTDITGDDPAIRRAGLERLRRDIEMTAEVGSRVLCGVLYAAWSRVTFTDRRQAQQWSVDALRLAGEVAARAGVTLGLEALNRYETSLLNTAAQARTLADDVGLPNVGVHLDTFHMNMEEHDMPGAIATAGARLVHFHCADGDRGAPGRSHIPWPRLIAALRATGYNGWLVMECGTMPGTKVASSFSIWREFGHGDAVAGAGVAFLRSLISTP